MPGIFGVVALDSSAGSPGEHQALARSMCAAMSHGCDMEAQLVASPSVRVWGGCIGIHPPAIDRHAGIARRVTVVCTGEPVADGQTARLPPDVHAIGYGAAEVASAYLRAGRSGLASVDANVSGFLLDGRSGTCLVFSDPIGRERVFVHRGDGRLFFASEAKAILAVSPRTRRFDPEGLASFMGWGCTLGRESLFNDIDVLDGGTVLVVRTDGIVRRQRYFTWGDASPALRAGDAAEGLRAALRTAVRRCVAATSSTALSLTGGLDSRMVLASVSDSSAPLPCVTFGSMYRRTADVAIASKVAAVSGCTHYVIELGRDFLDEVETLLDQAVYASDGYLGLSGAAELYLNRTSRTTAPARMTGNWGGELLRGVRAFRFRAPGGEFLRPELLEQVNASAGLSTSGGTGHPLSLALQQIRDQGYGRYAVERSQVLTQTPFLAREVIRWIGICPESSLGVHTCAGVIQQRPELMAIPTDTGELGRWPAVLGPGRRSYRRAIAKAEYLTSHGAPHWLAALAASLPDRLLERRFLGRDKFQHFRSWLRTALAPLVHRTLIASPPDGLEEWFDMRAVTAMVHAHVAGRANYTDEIDKVMTVAIAARMLLCDRRWPIASNLEDRPRECTVH